MRLLRHSTSAGVVALAALATATAPAPAQTKGVSPLAGAWTWSWKDEAGNTHKHVLEVEGVGSALAAREVFDDESPVKVGKLSFDGKVLKFAVDRNGTHADYEGTFDGKDALNGLVKITRDGQMTEFEWKPERRKRKEPEGSRG